MRFLKRIAIGLVLSVSIVALGILFLLRGSLPQLDGRLPVAGLRGDVTIERDAAGIPVITAANRADLAFATGFVHGQDRYFQMDLSRRRAAGELAELFGEDALAFDRSNRLHRFRARAAAVAGTLSGSDRDYADAYTAGVNAGLASLRVRPFEYLLLRASPRPWTTEDSILVAYNMYMELNDATANRDIRRGLAHEVLPPALYAFVYPKGTGWDAPLSGAATVPPSVPAAVDPGGGGALPAAAPPAARESEHVPGSNNWAVAGRLTDSGRAIVANDMHLGITVPGVFYRARLIVTGDVPRDLNGLTLPGAPVLIAGSNGRIAWGNTNSYGDWTDAVRLRPGSDADAYRVAGGERRFDTYEETIEVRGRAPEQLTVRETVWGPVVPGPADSGELYAVSWVAHKPRAVNLRSFDLELATSAAEALTIANTLGMPPQNFVVGDAGGSIGWTIAGQIPVRLGFDPQLPADWSDGAGWNGWLPPEQYPRILDPESGRIWTANARVVDGEMLGKIGDGGYDLGARAQQIRDGLFARERFAPADMLAIQTDDRALFLARWRDLLLDTLDAAAVSEHPVRGEYRDLAAGWSARASVDSAGYRLVRDFRLGVRDRVFDMLMRPVRERYGDGTRLRMSNQFEAPLWLLVNQRPAHLLSDDYPGWRDLLLGAVDANIKTYSENFDGPLAARTWGERNTARIQHPLSRALPILGRWLDMPRDQLPGDSNLPRAQGPAFGASERFGVAPGDEANGYLHMPSGQSGHPLSRFYRAGHDDWVNARPSPFLPGTPEYTLILAASGPR